MKILLISSGIIPVPPPSYGGLEQVIADLAIELDKMGHRVVVLCPEGSLIGTVGNIDAWVIGAPTFNAHAWEYNAFVQTSKYYNSFDIIHDHSWRKFSYLSGHPNIISTLHGICPYEASPIPKPCFVGISKNHAKEVSEKMKIHCECVYNGINLENYVLPHNNKKEGFYLFVGRINVSKGPHYFIQLMKQYKKKGIIIGDDIFVEDRNFALKVKRTAIENGIGYLGNRPRDFVIEMMQKCKAVVMPLDMKNWSEPFGLFVVEANACGVPVISTRNGALPELIKDGENGMLYDSPLSIKLDLLPSINKTKCRKAAEKFSRRKMAQEYLKLYEKILKGERW